jgi:hypothetical protein
MAISLRKNKCMFKFNRKCMVEYKIQQTCMEKMNKPRKSFTHSCNKLVEYKITDTTKILIYNILFKSPVRNDSVVTAPRIWWLKDISSSSYRILWTWTVPSEHPTATTSKAGEETQQQTEAFQPLNSYIFFFVQIFHSCKGPSSLPIITWCANRLI